MGIRSANKSREILSIDDHELIAEGLAKVLASRDCGLLVTISNSGVTTILGQSRNLLLEPTRIAVTRFVA